jgi:hypothetical protein
MKPDTTYSDLINRDFVFEGGKHDGQETATLRFIVEKRS